MHESRETGLQHDTIEIIKTEHKTENFNLKIITGKGHVTTKKLYRAIVKAPYHTVTGYFYTEFNEALFEGVVLLKEIQEKFDKEMEEYKKLYNARQSK